MRGLKLFFHFFKSALIEVLEAKKLYVSTFLALVILGNIESLSSFLGVNEESFVSIATTAFVAICSFIFLSQVVLLEKRKRGGEGELSYFVPTYLLYNLYYSFSFFLGLVFFVVPGIFALIFFSFAPFIAVLDDEADRGYFKKSIELVKKNISLVAWASGLGLILECLSVLVGVIRSPGQKLVVSALCSLPDAFLSIVLTITMVKIYYFLKEA